MSFFKGSIELPEDGKPTLPEEEMAVLKKLATWVVKKGMTVPAILFLESVKPLNYIGSQTMVFFEPMIQTVFNFRDYDILRSTLEKRESIEIIIQNIEEQDAIQLKWERAFKKWYKQEKKKWKWYQRYLGIFLPKLNLPEELKNKEGMTDTPSENKPSADL